MDRFNALGRGMQLMLVAGVLLLIDTLFNWQSYDLGPITVGQSAWHGFGGVLLGLLVIVLVAWLFVRLAAVDIPLPVSATLIAAFLGFLIFIITTLRNIDLHPLNYFFLAAAFFAFHLLLAYLVDHISIHAAMIVSSVVSVALVVSYLRLVVGIRFAALEAGTAQLIYLVIFSYAFFWKGFTGLAITVISIITLFVVMQATGKVKWSEKFAMRRGGGLLPSER